VPQYDDMFLRDAIDDTGQVPYTGRTVCFSPDIIPYGQTNVTNPDAFFGGNYGQDLGQTVTPSSNNNIYVRVKNLGAGATSPRSGARRSSSRPPSAPRGPPRSPYRARRRGRSRRAAPHSSGTPRPRKWVGRTASSASSGP
jgi:hypothetical protein